MSVFLCHRTDGHGPRTGASAKREAVSSVSSYRRTKAGRWEEEYGYGSRPRAGVPVASLLTARSPHGAALPHQLSLSSSRCQQSPMPSTRFHGSLSHTKSTAEAPLHSIHYCCAARSPRPTEARVQARNTPTSSLQPVSAHVLQPLPVFAAPKHGSCSREAALVASQRSPHTAVAAALPYSVSQRLGNDFPTFPSLCGATKPRATHWHARFAS